MVLWRFYMNLLHYWNPCLWPFLCLNLLKVRFSANGWLLVFLELFSFPLQLRKIRNTSYARSKVSLKLLMPYLRHFKWAICLNIFLSLPHFFLIISSTYSWAMGGLLCSLPVSRACLPPLNTSMCLHNTALRHAGKFLNWVQMNGTLSEGLFLLTKICMQVLTSAAVEFSRFSGSICRPLTGAVMTRQVLDDSLTVLTVLNWSQNPPQCTQDAAGGHCPSSRLCEMLASLLLAAHLHHHHLCVCSRLLTYV